MINKALSQITPTILDLCWVERFCPVVRTAKRKLENGKVQSFPVSCNCGEDDCWNKGRWKDLVPNSKYKSIVYFDNVSNATISDFKGTSRRSLCMVEVDLKMVAWLNLKLLGKDDCDFCNEIFGELMSLVSRKYESTDPNVGKIDLKLISMDSKETTEKHFSKYSYGDIQKLFFYPYEACSFNFKLSFVINKNCIDKIECGEPIECIEL